MTVREVATEEASDKSIPAMRATTDQLRAKLREAVGDMDEIVFEALMTALSVTRFTREHRTMPKPLLKFVGALAGLMLSELYGELMAEIEAEEEANG